MDYPSRSSGYTEKYAHGARNITEKGLKSSRFGSCLQTLRWVSYESWICGELPNPSTNQGFKSFVLPGGIDPSFVFTTSKRQGNH